MFCLWSVAKPNYYVPCEPGVALLVGWSWVRLVQIARETSGRAPARARRLIQFHWLGLTALAIACPVMASKMAPHDLKAILPATLAASTCIALGVALSIVSWRRGAESGVLAPLAGGLVVAMAIGYAAVVPRFNAARSHRALALALDRALPADVRTVMFYRELDEGLWFYLKDRTLAPVPGSAPRYNSGFDFLDESKNNTLIYDQKERLRRDRQILMDWLVAPTHASPYVLVRAKVYDLFNPGLDAYAEPVFRESSLDRNELVLLRIRDRDEVAKGAGEVRK